MFDLRPGTALSRVASCLALTLALALPPALAAAPAAKAPAPQTPAAPPAPVPTSIDLAGVWKFATDRADLGQAQGWYKPDFDSNSWRTINVPGPWEEQGITYANPAFPDTSEDGSDGYNGYAWYRRAVVIPAGWAQGRVTLHVGAIDDADWTYLNGTLVGQTEVSDGSYRAPRDYTLPTAALRPGKPNVIAIRVLDKGGQGGLTEGPVELSYGAAAAAPTTSAAPGGYAQSSGSITKTGADVEVPQDMKVNGDVTVMGGDVTVDGYVTGSVSAVGGSVYLNSTARVDGDVSSIGGQVERAEGAVLGGSTQELASLPGVNLSPQHMVPEEMRSRWDFGNLIVWLVLAVLAALLFPRRLEVMARALPADPSRAAITGLIGVAATPVALLALSLTAAVVTTVLAVTIVGIVAIPVVAIALAAGCVMPAAVAALGSAAVLTSLGQVVLGRHSRQHLSPLWSTLLGLVLVWVLSNLLASLNLGWLGVLVLITAGVFGFGVALMTGAGTNEQWSFREWRRHRQAGPPAPEAPAAPEGAAPASAGALAAPPPPETGEPAAGAPPPPASPS